MQLKAKSEERLNQYLDTYIREYAGINLEKHPCGDALVDKQQREAKALLDMIDILARELKREDVVMFVRKHRPFGIPGLGQCK